MTHWAIGKILSQAFLFSPAPDLCPTRMLTGAQAQLGPGPVPQPAWLPSTEAHRSLPSSCRGPVPRSGSPPRGRSHGSRCGLWLARQSCHFQPVAVLIRGTESPRPGRPMELATVHSVSFDTFSSSPGSHYCPCVEGEAEAQGHAVTHPVS